RFAGMMFPGNGCPVAGSVMTLARPKKEFAGFNSSLKSPCRIARDGTVSVWVVSSRRRSCSSPQKKNSLLRLVLNLAGMKIGPPRVPPYWLSFQGADLDNRGSPLALRAQVLALS